MESGSFVIFSALILFCCCGGLLVAAAGVGVFFFMRRRKSGASANATASTSVPAWSRCSYCYAVSGIRNSSNDD